MLESVTPYQYWLRYGIDPKNFNKEQEKAGTNKFNYYQLGANACIGCKADRPLKEKGEWCEVCKNYNK